MAAPTTSPHTQHYDNGPGQFVASPSSGSISSQLPLTRLQDQDLRRNDTQYTQKSTYSQDSYYESEKRSSLPQERPADYALSTTNVGAISHASYPGPQRQNTVNSLGSTLDFTKLNLNDLDPPRMRQMSVPTPAQALAADYIRSHTPQQRAVPQRAQTAMSNHSVATEGAYQGGYSLQHRHSYDQPIGRAQPGQSHPPYASTSAAPRASDGFRSEDAYVGQASEGYVAQGQYGQQLSQAEQMHEQNNAGQYYDQQNGQHYIYPGQHPQHQYVQQYPDQPAAGPSQQFYAQQPQMQHGHHPPPGQWGDPYAAGTGMPGQGQYAMPPYVQQGFDPYAGYNAVPAGSEPHRHVSAASSMSNLQTTSHANLNRNRTTTSNKTFASQTSDRDKPPITKQAVDEYRNRIKSDPDPETQFNFARFLVEAARRLAVAEKAGTVSREEDAKSIKKYRDALLQEALKLIKRLATQGSGPGKPAYADAQFFLANCLGHGALGLAIDHEKAYNLYVQASKQNHPAATYRTAVCNEVGAGTRRDPARAVLFYRKASALGDTAGMYKLGMILLNGLLAQPRNPREAVNWLKKAAAQADEENPHALHELGALYEKQPEFTKDGQAVPTPVMRDEAQAREFYTQAAQFGYPPSQYKLGSCYEYGALGCPIEPRRSIAWYTRAAEKGHAESELALSGWYLTGSQDVLKQSDSEAYLWARRAANKGLSKAEYAVGYYSEIGIGVKPDLEEAKMWYLRSAASGNRRAMQRLSELKKLGAKKAGAGARPTRQQAQTECIIS